MNQKLQIQKSIEYIEKHLNENINLNEIAKQSHFSEFHFHRLFSKSVGVSVMEYVRQRRLSEAARDLAGTDEKITDIAFKYQFSSEEAFSRSFKRLYTISPRAYRNMYSTAVRKREISSSLKAERIIKKSGVSLAGGITMCRAA